ncbi:hypothetical protein HDU77_002662 [Chytriomyces hyalinus]|nr:hypothetical protein HDU77_002662 [Chytriomyces hyalinus]
MSAIRAARVKSYNSVTASDQTELDRNDLNLCQIKFLDYLHQDWNAAKDFTWRHRSESNQQFDIVRAWKCVSDLASSIDLKSRKPSHLIQLIRTLYISHRLLLDTPAHELNRLSAGVIHSNSTIQNVESAVNAFKSQLQSLTNTLAQACLAWITPPFFNIGHMHIDYQLGRERDGEVGIVILSSTAKFQSTVRLIHSLRTQFEIEVPIHVFYSGPNAMKTSLVSMLNRMKNVKPVDVHSWFPLESRSHKGDLEDRMIVFSILGNTFTKLVVMDARVGWFKNPLTLLESNEFKQTGFAIFRSDDGSIASQEPEDILSDAGVFQHLMWVKFLDGFRLGFMKSGGSGSIHLPGHIIAVDKFRTSVFYALLMAATLEGHSVQWQSDFEQNYVKSNLFWISSEALRVPYAFTRGQPGAMGQMHEKTILPEKGVAVCNASKVYRDEDGEMLFWISNGQKSELRSSHAIFSQGRWSNVSDSLCYTSPDKNSAVALKEAARQSIALYCIEENTLPYDIDLAQVQLLDYMNGEIEAADENMFGGSLRDYPNFSAVDAYRHIQLFFDSVREMPDYNRLEYGELARRSRSLYIAHKLLHDQTQAELVDLIASETHTPIDSLRLDLQHVVSNETLNLLPWIKRPFESIHEMHQSFIHAVDPVGVVITGGSRHFYLITHLITTLRREFQIQLPINVYFTGPQDMDLQMVNALNSMNNVKAVDLQDYFPLETVRLAKYASKPFSILAAPFRKVLFMDADVLFFKSPLMVLESVLFQKHGLLFYHDRHFRDYYQLQGSVWFNSINNHLSRYAKTLGYTNALQDASAETHETDSGFMPFDKGNLGVLFTLLFAAKMNSQVERTTLYANTHGDKESFWFSSEMLRVPYQFNPHFGGSMGLPWNITRAGFDAVCGYALLQLNEEGEPFWWNGGGLLKNRDVTSNFEDSFWPLTHVILDTDGDTSWEGGDCCVKPAFNLKGQPYVRKLNGIEEGILERYRDIYRYEMNGYNFTTSRIATSEGLARKSASFLWLCLLALFSVG